MAYSPLRLVEAAAKVRSDMQQKLLTIPFRYGIGFIPKGKRSPRDYVVAATTTVCVSELDGRAAPRVVAIWRPRPDEADGRPVEIRHDGDRFLAPVFPRKYDLSSSREGNQPRLTADQMLAALADPAEARKFFDFEPVAPDSGEKPALLEAELFSLGRGRIQSSGKAAWEAELSRRAARYVLIDGEPFTEVSEPLIRIDDYRPVRVDGVLTGKRQVSVILEIGVGEPFHFEGGGRLFRLTSADRARPIAAAAASRSHDIVNPTIDLEIRDPSVFAFDDVLPALGGELVAAGREFLNYDYAFQRSRDARRDELSGLLFVKDIHATTHFAKYRAASWDDPGLPRAAEVLRSLLDDGMIEARYLDRVSAAVAAFENRPGVDRTLSQLDEQLLGAISP